MTKSEQFAINEWLSTYPTDTTYDQLVDLMYADDESVVPVALLSGFSAHAIVSRIEDTRLHFEAVCAS